MGHLFCPYYIYPCIYSLLIIYIHAFILSILHISQHLFSPYHIYPCIYSVHITYIPASILPILYIYPCIYSVHITYIPAPILSLLYISLHLFCRITYIPAYILSLLYISLHLLCPYYIYHCIYSLLIIRPLQSTGMSIHLPLSVGIRRRP